MQSDVIHQKKYLREERYYDHLPIQVHAFHMASLGVSSTEDGQTVEKKQVPVDIPDSPGEEAEYPSSFCLFVVVITLVSSMFLASNHHRDSISKHHRHVLRYRDILSPC
jgi:hypothetical protein